MPRLLAIAIIGLGCAAFPAAQSQTPRSITTRNIRVVPGIGGSSSALATVVSAFVWDGENDPVKDITVRLRNVHSGHVEGTTVSNTDGRVTFSDIEGGTYVLEVVNLKAAVIATGQVFTVMPGETVATFVRLGSRLPWFAGIFSHAAETTVASAASLGATAVSVSGQPQSPGK